MLIEIIQDRRESDALGERREIGLSAVLKKGRKLMLKRKYLLEVQA